MQFQRIANTDIDVARLAYGCMRVAGTWNPDDVTPGRWEQGEKAIIAAYEAGYNLFDHADIYCRGRCEEIHGTVLKKIPSMRSQITIATKCGIRFPGDPDPASPHRYDFSAEYILTSCDKSLTRLGVDTIDIYQLHRPDLLMNPGEIADAFEKLHRSGKVRYFGVSNFAPSFVSCLPSGLSSPLIVNQVEIHLGRLDCFQDGTLDQCIAKNITPLAWSPLGGGWLGTGGKTEDPVRAKLIEVLDQKSVEYSASRTAISLAWLLMHPSKIIPIVGSANPENIRSAVRADEIEMTREDWYRILVAARGKGLP
jgi:predicted oxidoreductase